MRLCFTTNVHINIQRTCCVDTNKFLHILITFVFISLVWNWILKILGLTFTIFPSCFFFFPHYLVTIYSISTQASLTINLTHWIYVLCVFLCATHYSLWGLDLARVPACHSSAAWQLSHHLTSPLTSANPVSLHALSPASLKLQYFQDSLFTIKHLKLTPGLLESIWCLLTFCLLFYV